MKTMLYEIVGKNRYCGPAALATILGISTDHAASVARSVSGKTSIKGLSTRHFYSTLVSLGCSVQQISVFDKPTINQWLKDNKNIFKDRHVVIVAGNHYGTVLGSKYNCRLSQGYGKSKKSPQTPLMYINL